MRAKHSLFILISFFALNLAVAQTNVKKRDVNKLTDQAEEAFYNENYRQALALYQQLYQMNPEGADYYNYQIALCYLYSNIDNEKAMSYIEMVKESMSEESMVEYYYYNLAKSYHLNNRFEDAIFAYQMELALDANAADREFRKEVERQIQICRNALEFANRPLSVKIENTGKKVNTQFSEYRPVVSADESVLIFTSRREGSTGGKLDIDGKYFEDIYVTTKDELGYWKLPQKISPNINTILHEASVGLSPDGSELLLYKGNPEIGGLYISKQIGNEWAPPVRLGDNINSKNSQETSASISSDGKYIYFTSNRKGTDGGRDIWKAEKNLSGEWDKPENLGTNINTLYDEESPFIHPDGKTLYFSSKGHNSMGGYDIFKSVYENGNWSKPENIGYPVNTPGDDLHFVLTADGKNGYFTSSRTGTLGEQDIYKVNLDLTIPLILVKGVVKKDEPGEFKVTINVLNKQTNALEEYVYSPNPVTGKYLMILPPGNEYDMIVSAENYQPYIVNINIPNQNEFYELYQEIILRKKGNIREVTVANYFDDIRKAEVDMDAIASAEYLQSEMNKLITSSKAQGKNSETALANIDKLNKLTDHVSDNFNRIVEEKLPLDAKTISYSENQKQTLQPVIIGNTTVHAIPSSAFVSADLQTVAESIQYAEQSGELVKLKAELAKAKAQPKSGNYIIDLANERYIENLEEEIAAIEGGYAMVSKGKKSKTFAQEIKTESNIYGTQSKTIVDKEKELAAREDEIAMKESQYAELVQLRDELEKAKNSKPSGNYITDLANQRYIENLEEEIAAIEGGYSPRYKQKGFAQVKKESDMFGTKTTAQPVAIAEKEEEKKTETAVSKAKDLSEKEKELAVREASIAKKEAELAEREKQLSSKEKEFKKRENALTLKETAKGKEEIKHEISTGESKIFSEKIIYFEYNKFDVQPQFHSDLDFAVSALNENSTYKLEIGAHTDSKGTDAYNVALSKRRADAVVKYFTSKGINRNRMSLKYFGESQPLAPNSTPDGTDNPSGRDKNRRAEIKIKN